MKILITNGWHDDNKGDCGIVLSIIRLFSSFGDIHFTILSEFKEGDARYKNAYRHIKKLFPNVTIKPALWPVMPVEKVKSNNRYLRKITRRITKLFFKTDLKKQTFLLENYLKKYFLENDFSEDKQNIDQVFNEHIDMINQMDLVISKGGSFIFSDGSINGSARLARVLYPLYLSIKNNKPIVLFSQSIFGIESILDKAIVEPVLKRSLVLCRENISKDYLSQRIENLNIRSIPDSAFSLSIQKDKHKIKHKRLRRAIERNQKIIGLTVRAWGTERQQGQYIKKVSALIKKIIQKDNNIVIALIPQVIGPGDFENDQNMMKMLVRDFSFEIKKRIIFVRKDFTPYELMQIYSKMFFIIGTRLHSVIFALTAGVPGIAISYSAHKSFGIMKDLGLNKYVFQFEELDLNKMYNMIIDLMTNIDSIRKSITIKINQNKNILNNEAKYIVKDYINSYQYMPLKENELEWINELVEKGKERIYVG